MRTIGRKKLVVLDFSGTLSLDTVLFGREENLALELDRTGLAALGVESPESFWNKLAGPTWEEGSTTSKGYKRVMAERLGALLAAQGRWERENLIAGAVSAFAEGYFAHSSIDPAWGNLLLRLSAEAGNLCLVATDHYAEATDRILGQLAALGVHARPALSPEGGAVLVANSADLGCRKADRAFWDTLRDACGIDSCASVLVVDDFGFNEQPGDAYGEDAKVSARRGRTARLLEEVFRVPPEVFPFFLERPALSAGGARLLREYRDMVRRAEEFVFSRLSSLFFNF